MAEKQNRESARQTFRQFAWNLAGTLVKEGQKGKTPARAGTARRSGGSKR